MMPIITRLRVWLKAACIVSLIAVASASPVQPQLRSALRLSAATTQSGARGTVFHIPGQEEYLIQLDSEDDAPPPNARPAVRFTYNDTIDTIGWGYLEIETVSGLPDVNLAHAAGYAEGAATWLRVYQHHVNVRMADFKGEQPSAATLEWLSAQMQWLRERAGSAEDEKSPEERRYWLQMKLLLAQFDGLVKGYNDYCDADKKLTAMDLWILNSSGDLETLIPLLQNSTKPANEDIAQTDCSALVKIISNGGRFDVLTGHNTWRSYMSMLRIYKFYTLNYADEPSSVNMAGSPGFLSSKDDFYITDRGLVAMETTNNVFNASLWQYLTPKSVLTWQRSILANQLAATGAEWISLIAKYNSGTYNNQWIVVDYNQLAKAEDGALPKTDLLWILEQIPGTTRSQDMTETLVRDGFWASYNIPYFEDIFVVSGYPAQVEKHGAEMSYANCSRARIFRRDAPKVASMDDFKRFFRSNDYMHDPVSAKQPDRAIASRLDLRENNAVAFGAIDAKVTNAAMVRVLASEAVSGPTSDSVPAFSWSQYERNHPGQEDKLAHIGQPDVWNFPYVYMAPTHNV